MSPKSPKVCTLAERREQGLEHLARTSPEIADLITRRRIRNAFQTLIREIEAAGIPLENTAVALGIPMQDIRSILQREPMIDNMLQDQELAWLDHYMQTGEQIFLVST
jgi:hypothetical protein